MFVDNFRSCECFFEEKIITCQTSVGEKRLVGEAYLQVQIGSGASLSYGEKRGQKTDLVHFLCFFEQQETKMCHANCFQKIQFTSKVSGLLVKDRGGSCHAFSRLR